MDKKTRRGRGAGWGKETRKMQAQGYINNRGARDDERSRNADATEWNRIAAKLTNHQRVLMGGVLQKHVVAKNWKALLPYLNPRQEHELGLRDINA